NHDSGGLSTSFKQLKANLALSAVGALTGVGVPMALSFVLIRLVGATPLQAFGAGAALCSTSIGTTFTILSTTGLHNSRLGTVLSGAAMMDDVAGLVMVQIISNLGGSGSDSVSAATVVRPICVAIGFAIAVVFIAGLVVKPVSRRLGSMNLGSLPQGYACPVTFVLHMATLIGFVAGASYAGTSSLFAAYLAGASISWFDDLKSTAEENPHVGGITPAAEGAAHQSGIEMADQSGATVSCSTESPEQDTGLRSSCALKPSRTITGQDTFEAYCLQPLHFILCPFFFASIGFAIPITKMFQGQVVWRGIVYTILMALGKVVTGIWLLPVSTNPMAGLKKMRKLIAILLTWCTSKTRKSATKQGRAIDRKERKSTAGSPLSRTALSNQQPADVANTPSTSDTTSSLKPHRSLYPSSIFGLAMIARGEIGYLIASVAESGGLFAQPEKGDSGGDSEIYLIVIWAITLCTIIGPVCVGTLVKRVKKLQSQRSQSGSPDPLGVWGLP
ncbi:Na+/H+ antiporter, partial [Penicillium diatomitis]